MRLRDRVALITGSGSGIGRATAELFAREGARIAVVDIVEERARETVELIGGAGGEALALTADVSMKAEVDVMVEKAVAEYGRIDILVNNAAIVSGDNILDIDEEQWDTDLRVVLKSVMLCCKAVLPDMIERKSGAIVNIASVNALAAFTQMAYSAAKAGVVNLTKNMAVSYGPHQVRINAICPGTVHTPIWDIFLQKEPKVLERLAGWYPLGRVGKPEDIANAALFLASDEAAWITGETLVVDGGLMAGDIKAFQEIGKISELFDE